MNSHYYFEKTTFAAASIEITRTIKTIEIIRITNTAPVEQMDCFIEATSMESNCLVISMKKNFMIFPL